MPRRPTQLASVCCIGVRQSPSTLQPIIDPVFVLILEVQGVPWEDPFSFQEFEHNGLFPGLLSLVLVRISQDYYPREAAALSTKLGYLRPAALARARAQALSLGESFLSFFVGSFFSQNFISSPEGDYLRNWILYVVLLINAWISSILFWSSESGATVYLLAFTKSLRSLRNFWDELVSSSISNG